MSGHVFGHGEDWPENSLETDGSACAKNKMLKNNVRFINRLGIFLVCTFPKNFEMGLVSGANTTQLCLLRQAFTMDFLAMKIFGTVVTRPATMLLSLEQWQGVLCTSDCDTMVQN